MYSNLRSDKSEAKLISPVIKTIAEGAGWRSAKRRNDCLNFSSAAFFEIDDTWIKLTYNTNPA